MALPHRAAPEDGIAVLQAQHQTIRSLLDALGDAPAEDRQRRLDELCGCLTSHEAAENLLLRPITRICVLGGEVIADARTAEESDCRRTLDALQDMDRAEQSFRAGFEELSRRLLVHLDSEERYEFPLVRAYRDEDALFAMGAVLRRTESDDVRAMHFAMPVMAAAVMSPLASAVGKVRGVAAAAKP